MIFDNHYDYMHRRITTDPTKEPLGFVVPQITCVWGPFSKKVLTEAGHYPPEAVVVTGNWRYDRMKEIGRINTSTFKQNCGIAAGKKVVLILSSSHGQALVDYVRQCLQVIGKQPELAPLIRLHPARGYESPIRELVQEMGFNQRVFVEQPLVEALLAADLVISEASTTIGEAALLEKPTILVDFQNQAGTEAYVESGICIPVTRQEELGSAIEMALHDDLVLARLNKARKEFISRYFFKMDGCAAQRVVETLEARVAMRA